MMERVAYWRAQDRFCSVVAGRRQIGWGVGLMPFEAPHIAFGSGDVLQVGMTVTMLLCFDLPSGGRAGVAHTGIVTARGIG